MSNNLWRARICANAKQRRLGVASLHYLTRLASPATLSSMVAIRDTAISQLRRGVIEFCVLALLRDSERYGFELVQALADAGGLVTTKARCIRCSDACVEPASSQPRGVSRPRGARGAAAPPTTPAATPRSSPSWASGRGSVPL